jgi:phosphatidylglycerophosphatase A
MMRNPRWARYWATNTVVRLATLGSLGDFKAPGTWGSAAGVLFYMVIFYKSNEFVGAMLMLASCYFAVGICGEAEKRLKKVDPGSIIIDEVVAMPICFIGLKSFIADGHGAIVLIGGFLVFRVFDILKPFGIKKLQRYYGGFGVVIDDVVAGLATCLVMNVALRLWLF